MLFQRYDDLAALLFLAAKFPDRQFNSSKLCVLSGIGRTAMSQIKNAARRLAVFALKNARCSGSTDAVVKLHKRRGGRYQHFCSITTLRVPPRFHTPSDENVRQRCTTMSRQV